MWDDGGTGTGEWWETTCSKMQAADRHSGKEEIHRGKNCLLGWDGLSKYCDIGFQGIGSIWGFINSCLLWLMFGILR